MYSFECKQCGKRFDQIVSYDRRHEVTCPDCQGETRVLLSGFAVNGGGGSGSGSAPRTSGFS
jgi:putative FmdB family regulatory protein